MGVGGVKVHFQKKALRECQNKKEEPLSCVNLAFPLCPKDLMSLISLDGIKPLSNLCAWGARRQFQ